MGTNIVAAVSQQREKSVLACVVYAAEREGRALDRAAVCDCQSGGAQRCDVCRLYSAAHGDIVRLSLEELRVRLGARVHGVRR